MHETIIVVAFRMDRQEWLAIQICIRGTDVYLNYFHRDGKKQAHASYHASGQYHIKTDRGYVYWRGAGPWQPMKQSKSPPGAVTVRETLPAIGWQIGSLASALPPLSGVADMTVDVSAFPANSIVGLEASVIQPNAPPSQDVTGFSVVQRQRFSNGVNIEIEAILIDE
jgi:hypothetical protein